MKRSRSQYLLSLSFLAICSHSAAVDRVVPLSYPTIQAAINACGSGDRVLLQPKTYNERINFNGKNITVKPFDSDFAVTLDGGAGGPVVTFAGSEPSSAQLSGLIIQNGLGTDGGGIAGNFTLATIKNCIIRTSKATGKGGGVYGISGQFENNQVLNNEAGNGGGVAGSDGVMLGNTIGLNKATSAGGGIYECTGIIQSNIISTNEAGTNGGGGADLTTGTMVFNTISGNKAAVRGGGVYNCGMEISGNTILGNQVTTAGSLASPGSFGAGLSNCTGPIIGNDIRQNVGNGRGGGLDNCSGDLINNVIYNNSSRTGGAFSNCAGNILQNTIYGNTATISSGGMLDSSSPINCIVYNNVPTNPQITGVNPPFYCCVQSWSGGGSNNITLQPQLVGGTDGDMHLLSTSPCIDAGMFLPGVLIDFEGDARGTSGTVVAGGDGSRWDIGADEFVPPFINLVNTWTAVTPKVKGTGTKLKFSVKGTLAAANSGNVSTGVRPTVSFFLSTDTVFDSTDTTIGKTVLLKKPLLPLETKSVKLKGKLATGQAATGLYLLGVADPTNAIGETNESDNVAVYGPLP